MQKTAIHTLFRQIRAGGVNVHYWDGEEVAYGPEEPKVTIIFHQPPLSGFSLENPVVAFGEAYMDGVIDFSGDFTEILRLLEANKKTFLLAAGGQLAAKVLKTFGSMTNKLKQKQNIEHHYDLGNDFFSLWLDETMSYSCGYFTSDQDSLHQAQLQKVDHTLRKLQLKPGERLLDIGSGWGWLIIRAAQQYGVKALGITLSKEQFAATQQRIARLGLSDNVDVKLLNYLDLDEKEYQFDKIVSVGMFEHVGKENLPCYMEKVSQLLAPGGLSLLHTITGMREDTVNPWMEKYIFPGGYVPSLRETIWLLPDYDFHLITAESLRMHYAMTLDHWYDNFHRQIDVIREKFGQQFVRMWGLYLQGCAASFRVSGLDIYQLLFSKGLNNRLPLVNSL